MSIERSQSRVSLGMATAVLALTLVGCQSGTTAAPVTSTVTSVLTSELTQTATVTTTDTITGPDITVMRTTTKPAPAPVTKLVTKTATATVTKSLPVTVTSEASTTEQESTGDDGGSARLAKAEQAADDIAEAASAAGWTGPICDPDVNLHRKESGQELLGDNELADTCEANVEKAKAQIANARPSESQRPDPTTVEDTIQANYDHVKKVLGINRDPSSGEVQIVYACEQGYATADECSIVHEEWDN